MLRVLTLKTMHTFREAFKRVSVSIFHPWSLKRPQTGKRLCKDKENPPHLIFMDIRLRGMNGLQLTQKIKRDFPNIPIAILRGYDLPEYRQAAVQYGADRFFVKSSFKWDEVEALVKSISPGVP